MLYKSIAEAQAALGADWQWPYFSIAELACRCAGRFCEGAYWHDAAFLDALEALRAGMGGPLTINSGHRCKRWNTHIGGAARSRHLTLAVDISLIGQNRWALHDAAIKHGFTGIGRARSFLHLDRRRRHARWYYAGSRASWKKTGR